MPLLGDGGPIFGGPYLNANPEVLECGDLLAGTARNFTVVITNTGDSNLELTSVVSSDAQVTLPSFTNQTIAPGSSYNLAVRVTPAGAGAGSAELTTASDGINNPVVIPVSWVGVAAGTVAVTVEPPEWTFPNQEVGVASSEKLFTVRNTGSVNVTVNAPTFTADFVAGATVPAYPVVLAASATLQFGVVFNPVAAGYISGNVQVNSTAAASPFLVTCSGEGFLITPAYVVGAVGIEAFLLGFALESTVVVREQDWADFNTEVETRLQKLHNFGRLAEDKTVAFFWFHYEDHGVCAVEITLTNQVTETDVVTNRTIGSVDADQAILLDYFELASPLEGENILLKIRRLAGQGKLFIIDYGFIYKPAGELLGTVSNPKTITPAYTLTGTEYLLFGFQGIVRRMNPSNFETEDDAYFLKNQMLPFPTEQGQVPGFTYEKTTARVFFHYEDYGVATVRITVTSMRGQAVFQDVVIGTIGADQKVKNGVADVIVRDEICEVKFTRIAGSVFIVDYTMKYVIGGERQK